MNSANGDALLKVRQVSKHFGGVRAVSGVSFDLAAKTVLGLIGPNGSGKTTLINTINGVYQPDSGSISLEERRIDGLPAHRLTDFGITRTFQTPHVFLSISVLRNMLVPMVHRRVDEEETTRRARDLLGSVGLDSLAHLAASELSGGQQKLLEFVRALMPNPRLVLMDEPFAGVHPVIKSTLFERIEQARSHGLSLIIVSHEIPAIMGLSREVICMDTGEVVGRGSPDAIRGNPAVIEAYLGQGRRGTRE